MAMMIHRMMIIALTILQLLLVHTTTGVAQSTMYVHPSNGNDTTANGTSVAPFRTIGAALTFLPTQTSSKVNSILLAAGSYAIAGNTDFDLVSMMSSLGNGSELTISCPSPPCTISGAIKRFASVDCAWNPVVEGRPPCMSLTLIGLTINGGNATRGGCLSAINTNLTLTNTVLQGALQQGLYISGTSLTTSGGAIQNNGWSATSLVVGGGGLQIGGRDDAISIVSCTSTLFSVNYATTSSGGGIAIIKSSINPTATTLYAAITLLSCTFQYNTAPAGGAIMGMYVTLNATLCTFTSNTASNGAGAIANLVNVGATLWTACRFNYNYGTVIASSPLTSTGSGGIYISTGSSSFYSCTWQGNSGFWGSCLQVVGAGAHRIYSGIFQSNSAVYGMVDIGKNTPRPDVAFIDTVFSGNTASGGSAGINAQSPTVITGCTFTGNYAYNGGALSITVGGTRISDTFFAGNYATFQGGAILISYAGFVNTTVTRATFISNSSPSGGAIVSSLGNAIWDTCTFVSNNAYTLVGGGAILLIDGTHSLIGCTFTQNSAPNGGAIMISNGAIFANASSFTVNTATVNGGAVYRSVNTNTNANLLPLPQVFTLCTFTANHAPQGGALATVVGQITVRDCQFIANSAVQGGAMSFQGGTITVAGGAVIANTATGSGGGIYHSSGDMSMTGVTFTGCLAGLYGGAYSLISDAGVNPTVNMDNLPVLGSSAAAGGAFAFQGGIFNFISAFCAGNHAVGGLNIEGAGGCLLILAGATVNMAHSVMSGNSAFSTGGAVHHSTSTSTLIMHISVFTGNSAITGGAISFKGPFQLTGDSFSRSIVSSNSAERGGAVYAEVCPLPFYSTTFAVNVATRAGGAFHWAAAAPLCDAPCMVDTTANINVTVLSPWALAQGQKFLCIFDHNTALVGPDMATEAHHIITVSPDTPPQNYTTRDFYTETPMNYTSGIPTSLSVLDGTLTVQVRVMNYYGEVMRSIDGVDESMMVGLTATVPGVIINGRSLETVVNGIATFSSITLKPDESLLPSLGTSITLAQLSYASLSIDCRPSLPFGGLAAGVKLADIVLPGDYIKEKYSGGSVVLALLVAVVGSWTSVIFIEEAVFCMQGKVKSHMPYTFVASIALGLCGVWGAFVMELGAISVTGVSMELVPSVVMGSIPIAIFVVWIAVEFYVREFGRRAQRIQKTPRAEFTYNAQDVQSKADSADRRGGLGAAGTGDMAASVDGNNASNKSSSGGSNKTTPKIAPAPIGPLTPAPPKVYPAYVRIFRDFMLPRLIVANIVMGTLLALLTLLLTSAIRWQANLTINSGNLIAGIIVGVATSHIAFWLMFNLSILRFICPFAVAGSSLAIHHIVMTGNKYTYEPTNTWTDLSWTPTSYVIIVSAVTAVMCFLFTGIQFSRMQLSRNALHVILNKAKGQIAILETSLGDSRKQSTSFEKNASDLSRMLELIAYCGPTYTDHAMALSFAKDKQHKAVKEAPVVVVTAAGGPSVATPTAVAGAAASSTANNSAPLQAFTPMQHSESSYLTTLEKIEEATKDPAGILAKLEVDLELRDIVKNAVTLEIFKHFMMSEHAAESLGLYLDIQRFKMLATKEARAAMGQRMVHEYLEEKSPQEVNVGQATRVQVMKEVAKKNWPVTMFEPVEKALYSLMSMDTMVRFRKTKDYVTCALLLGTFGSLDRAVVDLPTAPPLSTDNDGVSIVRSVAAGSSGGNTPVHAGSGALSSIRYELPATELTPLSAASGGLTSRSELNLLNSSPKQGAIRSATSSQPPTPLANSRGITSPLSSGNSGTGNSNGNGMPASGSHSHMSGFNTIDSRHELLPGALSS